MNNRFCCAALVAVSFWVCDAASGVVLYDGPAGTAPETQGWLAYQELGSPLRTTAGGKTTLDTTFASSIQAGYANYNLIFPVNPSFPPLDRTAGYVVSLDMKLLAETHASNDRAGVSLIVLSSDLSGIELGFWGDQVWAQSGADFLHAEGAAFNTTAATNSYDLAIHGGTYELFANGNSILAGNLRNYSSFGLPYSLANLVFVGDDTTSAAGSFEFSRLAVVVPEPMGGALAGVGLLGLRRRKRRLLSGAQARGR